MRATFKSLQEDAARLANQTGRKFKVQTSYNQYALIEEPAAGGGFHTHSRQMRAGELAIAIDYMGRGFTIGQQQSGQRIQELAKRNTQIAPLVQAAREAEEAFRNFAGFNPGACLTLGTAEHSAVEFADKLAAGLKALEPREGHVSDAEAVISQAARIRELISQKIHLERSLDNLLKAAKQVQQNPYTHCQCAEVLRDAIALAEVAKTL